MIVPVRPMQAGRLQAEGICSMARRFCSSSEGLNIVMVSFLGFLGRGVWYGRGEGEGKCKNEDGRDKLHFA